MKYSTRFGDAKTEYVHYRPQYPDALFEIMLNSTPRPFSKALDVGAGTGISTIFLSKYFDAVYAVEPDSNMIKDVKFPENVTVHNCTAEDFDCVHNDIALITVGNAFYWMDGEIVALKADKWLRKHGLFAAYRYNFPKVLSEAQEILAYELKNHWNTYRSERLMDTDYTYRTIQNSNVFSKIDGCEVPNVQSLTPESIVGFFASTSYGSAYMKTLENREHYISNLIESIEKVSHTKTIDVDFSLDLVLAIK